MNLYTCAQNEQNKIALCVDEDGVLDVEKMDAITCAFNDKASALAAFILNLEAEVGQIDKHLEAVSLKRQERLKKIESLKVYLSNAMNAAGVFKVVSADKTLNVKFEKERDTSVEVDDLSKVPERFLNEQKPAPERTVDKTKVKAALKNGELVGGVTLLKKDRLSIK
jgi:hypothetical protein